MIAGLLKTALCAGLVVTTGPAHRVPVGHDFHVSYTRMAIESSVISAQIRVFSDDILKALSERTRTPALALASKPAEAAFQAYLAEQFPIVANGRKLAPVVVSGAADQQMWSYIVTWTAPAPITTVTMHNATLMEQFGDQQNIVKLKVMTSGREETLFFAGGSRADQVVRL